MDHKNGSTSDVKEATVPADSAFRRTFAAHGVVTGVFAD